MTINGIKEKLVIVINGSGETGKDTLCELAMKHYKCWNISSIDPFREMADLCGWNGIKDKKYRKLLSMLKAASIEYNDWPTKYLIKNYYEFERSDADIMFVHIREPNEITKFITNIPQSSDIEKRDAEILVKRSAAPTNLGNDSDDGVDKFPYDATFVNDECIEVAEAKFVRLIDALIRFNGLQIAPIKF